MLWSASYFGVRFLLVGSPSSPPPPPPTNGGTPVAMNHNHPDPYYNHEYVKMKRAA